MSGPAGAPRTCVDGSSATLPATGIRLLDWLRDELGVTAPKEGCGTGACGACTVLIDGAPALSCCVLAPVVADKRVSTAASVARTERGSELAAALARGGGIQCGFCAPGMLLASCTWLEAVAEGETEAGENSLRRALVGNICRCTGYGQIVSAVLEVAVAEAARQQARSRAVAGGRP